MRLAQQCRYLLGLTLAGLGSHLWDMCLWWPLLWCSRALLPWWIHWSRQQRHGRTLLRAWWKIQATADWLLVYLVRVPSLQRSLLCSMLIDLCACLSLSLLLLCLSVCLCHLDLRGILTLEILLERSLSLSLRHGCVLGLSTLSKRSHLSVVVAGRDDLCTRILQSHCSQLLIGYGVEVEGRI